MPGAETVIPQGRKISSLTDREMALAMLVKMANELAEFKTMLFGREAGQDTVDMALSSLVHLGATREEVFQAYGDQRDARP